MPLSVPNITALRLARPSVSRGVLCILGLYVVLAPSITLIPGLGAYDAQRLAQVLVLLAIALVVILSKTVRDQVASVLNRLTPLSMFGLAALLALGLISAAAAARPVYAFLEIGHLTLLLLAAAIVAAEAGRAESRIVRFVTMVVLSLGLLYVFRFALSYAGHFLFAFPLWPNSGAGFSHPRFVNQLQVWTLPLMALPAFVLFRNRTWAVRLVVGLMSVWWALLFATGGRATTLALGVGIVAAAFIFRRSSGPYFKMMGISLVLGVGLYLLLFKVAVGGGTGATLLERLGDGDTGRLFMWEHAISLVRENPWLGAGPMHYAFHMITPAAHPHNVFFQLLSEWGIPATIAGAMLLLMAAKAWIRRINAPERSDYPGQQEVHIALTVVGIAVVINSFLDGLIVVSVSQMMLVLVGGCVWGMSADRATSEKDSPRIAGMVAGFAVCALIAVSSGVMRDVLVLEERQEAFRARVIAAKGQNVTTTFRPRYWQHGFIEDLYPPEAPHLGHAASVGKENL